MELFDRAMIRPDSLASRPWAEGISPLSKRATSFSVNVFCSMFIALK